MSLVNRYTVAFLISLVTASYVISEIRRMYGKSTPLISYITFKAAGKSEYQEFVTSPLFYALGIIIALLLFTEPISYVSIVILTLGDGAASAFGKKFGKRRIPFNKSKNFEGTLCGFLSSLCGSLLFVDPLRALIASTAGMLAEILPLPVNDNLTVPLVSGLTLTVLTLL
jgi:dolichol kinase